MSTGLHSSGKPWCARTGVIDRGPSNVWQYSCGQYEVLRCIFRCCVLLCAGYIYIDPKICGHVAPSCRLVVL